MDGEEDPIDEDEDPIDEDDGGDAGASGPRGQPGVSDVMFTWPVA